MKTYEQNTIVAVGAFNPAIFHPDWFRRNEILPSAEVEAALNHPPLVATREFTHSSGLLVTRDFTQVRFESLLLQVTQDRWELATERPDWKKDLGPIVSSVFHALGHTPVYLVGFNLIVHRGVHSVDEVMRQWAPVGALAEVVGDENPVEPPRVGATVRGTWDGFSVQVGIEPSIKLEGSGVFLSQNFEKKLDGGAKELVEVTQRDWDRILKRAGSVVMRLLGEEP